MVKPIQRPEMRLCQRCRVEFIPTRAWQKYCSTQHQHDDWNERNDVAAKLRELRRRRRDEKEQRKL